MLSDNIHYMEIYMKKRLIIVSFGLFVSMISFVLTFFCDSNILYLFSILAIPFILFVSLSFHELGHFCICKLSNTKIISFQIYPFASKNYKKRLYYVEFIKTKKKYVKLILFGGIIFTVSLEIFIIILFFSHMKQFIFSLIINTLILLGICFNKNSDLKKIRSCL